MPRLDPRPNHALLLRVLRSPETLRTLSAEEFSVALDASQDARLLGWMVMQARSRALPTNVPEWLQDRMTSAQALVAEYDRSLHWEINRIQRALAGSELRWVLLKGAGYLAGQLPPGSGRRVADVDILVERSQIETTEALLGDHGWQFVSMDAYDERYYRDWMHESPPLIHEDRGSVVDVHHAILPLTGRLQPPTARLLERAVPTSEGHVLCPSHMVLHAAAHLFHDGEVSGAIRDLVDLQGLLVEFNRDPKFWDDLYAEADTLHLTRPAFYALRYARLWLGAEIPNKVVAQIARWGPPAPVLALMDRLVEHTLFGETGLTSSMATFSLYVRSHWLRMPPLLLIRHLAHKAFVSPR